MKPTSSLQMLRNHLMPECVGTWIQTLGFLIFRSNILTYSLKHEMHLLHPKNELTKHYLENETDDFVSSTSPQISSAIKQYTSIWVRFHFVSVKPTHNDTFQDQMQTIFVHKSLLNLSSWEQTMRPFSFNCLPFRFLSLQKVSQNESVFFHKEWFLCKRTKKWLLNVLYFLPSAIIRQNLRKFADSVVFHQVCMFFFHYFSGTIASCWFELVWFHYYKYYFYYPILLAYHTTWLSVSCLFHVLK